MRSNHNYVTPFGIIQLQINIQFWINNMLVNCMKDHMFSFETINASLLASSQSHIFDSS